MRSRRIIPSIPPYGWLLAYGDKRAFRELVEPEGVSDLKLYPEALDHRGGEVWPLKMTALIVEI